MPMNTSLAPFGQVLRKICPFKPWQSREPLPCHYCSRALSRVNAPPKLPYLLAHTSNQGVLELSRILTPWATHSSWPYPCDSYYLWVGGISNCLGPSFTLWSFGPSHRRQHNTQVSLRGPLCAHGVLGIAYGEIRDITPVRLYQAIKF